MGYARPIGETKPTKYNHIEPIDLDTITIEERDQALKEFAEGSLGLETCLRTMWKYGLKTHACGAAAESDYSIAYISMAVGEDIFGFLSSDLLDSDMIQLDNHTQNQVLYFGGPKEVKELTMLLVARDITTGKKDNALQVQNKIGKYLNEAWMIECIIHHMRKAGLTDEEIRAIIPEYNEYIRKNKLLGGNI